jgi:hypothetical protein
MTELLSSVLVVTLTRLVEKNVHVGRLIDSASQVAADQAPARLVEAAVEVGRA